MNKHFSAITALMDAALITPDEIKITESKNILIISERGFDTEFCTALENYCSDHELKLHYDNYVEPYFLIYNPKNP